jgi:NADPH:quinone reductase-like Zn-dependent oxidoreductase
MKAARLIKFAAEDAVSFEEIERPVVGEDKLLVEVHAAGVNPVDWKIRQGGMQVPLPITLGGDFAGKVVETGPGVKSFKTGDDVFGMAGLFQGGSGSFAEYALADYHTVAPRPAAVDETEAGGLPLTGVMALQALTEHFQISSGQKLLVQGGAGGIGSLTIQIAKHLGAYVAVTCAGGEFDYVRELGADEAIDFKTQRFEEIIHGFDAVYDLVGGEVYQRSFQVLKPGGIIVSSLMSPDKELMEKYQVTAIAQRNDPTSERLARLAQMASQGIVKVHVDRTFPLAEAGEAMTYQQTVHPRGKVVVAVK